MPGYGRRDRRSECRAAGGGRWLGPGLALLALLLGLPLLLFPARQVGAELFDVSRDPALQAIERRLFAQLALPSRVVQGGATVIVDADRHYPLIGGTGSVLGPIAGVLFFSLLIDGLRFLGDWRNLLFGVLIVAMMNVRPHGIVDVGQLCVTWCSCAPST